MAVALLAVPSCNDASCYDNGSSLPLVRFYASGGDRVTLSSVTLRGIGVPGDSILADKKSLDEVYLPLRATTSQTQWVIEVGITNGSTVADTLTVDYTPIPYFASAECGAMYSFEISNVSCSHNAIDSIVVTEHNVTNVAAETMRIYFRK